jgi:hypothetical protein
MVHPSQSGCTGADREGHQVRKFKVQVHRQPTGCAFETRGFFPFPHEQDGFLLAENTNSFMTNL